MTSPDPSATPTYRPAPYLVSGPGAFLTSEELVRYFEDFHASLGCVNTAPQMVFERLIGNLGGPVRAAIENARWAGASGGSETSITCLQVPEAAVLAPVIRVPSPAIPTPAVPPATIVPTTNVEQAVRRTPLHIVRSYSVEDCAEWNASSAFASTRAFTTAGKTDMSKFAIGLTSFQMPKSAQLIVSASITTPLDTGFTVSLTNAGLPGYSGCLTSASCSWIEFDENSIDVQCGVLNVPILKGHLNHDITFPMRYQQGPQILVWLRGLHMLPFVDHSVNLEVTNSGVGGFSLPISSTVQSLEISWLAFSDRRPGVEIGTFSSANNWKDNNVPLHKHYEGYVAFETDRFKTAPKVAVGITGFTIDKSVHLSLSVQVVQLTREGMKWRIDGGPYGHFRYAKGSYIAIE